MYGIYMGVFLSHLSILFENKVLSPELTYWLDWLASKPCGPSCLHLGALGFQECTTMANIFRAYWRSKLGTLCSPKQALHPRSHFPSSLMCILKLVLYRFQNQSYTEKNKCVYLRYTQLAK